MSRAEVAAQPASPNRAANDLHRIAAVAVRWFSTRKKQVFVDSGIWVTFVGASVATRLVATGAVEVLQEVLDRGEPKWCATTDAEGEFGRTLLDLDIGLGRTGVVHVLLRYDVDANKPSRGQTLLESAAAVGECLIAELLLAKGATPTGSDALHTVAAAGHDDVLKLLLLSKPASK